MRCSALLLALPLLLPLPLHAQAGALRPDARVRVELAAAPGEWVSGRVQNLSADTLVLRRGAGLHPVALVEAQRLEVSRGRNRAAWTAGGVLAGAAIGVIYSRATLDDDPADIGSVQNTAEGVANTLTGALFGGLVGYFVAPERWRAVTLVP